MFNQKEYNRDYWLKNKEKLSKNNKNYYLKNKEQEKLKAYSYRHNPLNNKKILENKKRYYIKNREHHIAIVKLGYLKNKKVINERMKRYVCERRKKDLDFNLRMNLRYMVWIALKRYSLTGKIQKHSKYGIDYEKIIEHLKPFPNNIKDYHIDHIIPISSFNLNNKDEIKRAFSPENLQWLPKAENIKKGNKLNYFTSPIISLSPAIVQ